MSQLAGLPLELLSIISNDLYPTDLINFALTCQQLHAASRQALVDHRAPLRRYRKVHNPLKGQWYLHQQNQRNLGSNGTGIRTAYLPNLLKAVIEKPKLGFYIRHLVLNDSALHFDFVPEDVPYVRRCYPECHPDNNRLFIRAAEGLGLDIHCRAGAQEMDTWFEAMFGRDRCWPSDFTYDPPLDVGVAHCWCRSKLR